jgi:hypothetical protein
LCLCLIVGCREDAATPPTSSPSSSAATSASASSADSTARSISRPAERSIALGVVPAEERTAAGFDSAQSAGVFVGVRKFSKDEELTEVMFAVDDAVDLAHLCVFTLDLIKPARAVLCLSGDPQKSESAKRLAALRQAGAQILDADQSTIYKVLQEQRKASGPAGLLVVHAATHGFSDQGTDYLVAADTFRGRIVRTGVAVSEVFDEVAQARTPRRLVLLDACRERLTQDTRAGGASAASPMGRAFSEAIAASAGQVVLAGTVQGGYSFDDVKRQNGVFTAAAMDALSGQAQPDSRGFITAGELATFVNDRVTQWVKENKPDHAATCTGIEKKIAGDGARLPLAISPRAFEGYKAYVERRKKAQATLKSLMDFETLKAERVQEVCKALDGADPSAGGPTVEKIELLGRKLPEYGPADFAKWWDTEGRQALVPATPTPRPTPEPTVAPTPEPTPAKSETAAWEALGKLETLAKDAPLERRIAMYDSFVGEWSGTKAAADAALKIQAIKTYDALQKSEPDGAKTKDQADARRAAWDDYLAKYAATEHQVAEARQRRDHWAAEAEKRGRFEGLINQARQAIAAKQWQTAFKALGDARELYPDAPELKTLTDQLTSQSPYTSASTDKRFLVSSENVILDTKTNLEWLVGPDRDTNYADAVKWVESCRVAGGGWRMPTRKDLLELYQKGKGDRNIDPVFKQTGWFVWAEPRDSSSACYVYFSDGLEFWGHRNGSYDVRAFGVRSRR